MMGHEEDHTSETQWCTGRHSHHCQVGVIIGSLAMKEGRLNLRPCRAGRHGDEEISTTIIVIAGQGILQELLHVAGAASKGGRKKNEHCAQLIPVSISICSHCIHQALVDIQPELCLMESDPVEVVLISNSPGLTHILLIVVAGEEDVIRLHIYGVDEEDVAMVLSQGDMLMLPILYRMLRCQPIWPVRKSRT